jgi:predicted GNAT family acetyltransferase
MAGAVEKDATKMNSRDVRDNAELHRFELDVEGQIAFAEYHLDEGVITFVHTKTPTALTGRGIASTLIRGALEQVRARGLKVIPQCSFVSSFIARHPQFADLLDHD